MYVNHTADSPGVGDKINLEDAVEVELWSKLFGVDPSELTRSVHKVGPEFGDLVAHFADLRTPPDRQHFGLD